MIKSLHSWSLFRTLGRYVAVGSMPSGDLPENASEETNLLELPAELARRGYRSFQLCHFYLASTDPGYLAELRSSIVDAGLELECFLIDDGDLTSSSGDGDQRAWISAWIAVAEQLGSTRARAIAGKRAPTPEHLALSARRLRTLALDHRGVRLLVENWHALLPDAASVRDLLERTEGDVGFLVDLGNWPGSTKYDDLAAVAGLAESCQAKCRADATNDLDLVDYRTSLRVLRDAGYAGPLALVYDGPDPDEWAQLEREFAVVQDVFAPGG